MKLAQSILGTLAALGLLCNCGGDLEGQEPTLTDLIDDGRSTPTPGGVLPPGSQGDGSALTSIEKDLMDAINAERSSRGLSTVTVRLELLCAARRHSNDIGEASACTHTGSDGSSPGDRVNDCGGGGWSGEIVACGQGTPEAAVVGWLNSDGHRAIMLNPDQVEIGVAVHNNFWTAIFDK